MNSINSAGIIDIGSNTIKAFVYKNDAPLKCSAFSERHTALLKYIVEGAITQEGVDTAISDIKSLMAFLKENGCDRIFMYATQATRQCSNCDKFLDSISEAAGLRAVLLSGKDEAFCDLASLEYCLKQPRFSAVNIGGGSGQIIISKQDCTPFCESFPIGSLKLSALFVSGCVPNKYEEAKISAYISEKINNVPFFETNTLYAMGGSALTLSKIFNKDTVSTEDIQMFIEKLRNMQNACEFLKKVAPGREKTIVTGAMAIKSTAHYFRAENIKILSCGTREGFLLKNADFFN